MQTGFFLSYETVMMMTMTSATVAEVLMKLMLSAACLVLLMLGAVTAGAQADAPPPAAPATGNLSCQDLKVEYLQEPLTIESPAPRLSWIVTSSARNEIQSAYQILVATTPGQLFKGTGDLWDSGKVASGATSQIAYAGKALTSRETCYWKVRAWDKAGTAGDWSTVSYWEMGLLNQEDWKPAQWIEANPIAAPGGVTITRATYSTADGKVKKDVTDAVRALAGANHGVFTATNQNLGGDPAVNTPKRLSINYTLNGLAMHTDVAEGGAVILPMSQIPYLRKSFVLQNKPVRSARLYASALGVYNLSVNGGNLDSIRLAPGWTDYRKRVRYQVYDVTRKLRAGVNVIGAMVAPGWYAGHAGLFGAYQFYGPTPEFIAMLEIEYIDGSTQRLVTDGTWKTHAGPYYSADILQGDFYDGRAEAAGWDTPPVQDDGWQTVKVDAGQARHLQASIEQPIRKIGEVKTLTVRKSPDGGWIFDLGQNMVGVIQLNLRVQKPGTEIRVRYGEVLNPDGSLYTTNLRGAASTDTYICKGSPEGASENNSAAWEIWEPQFTYHGFRYVEIDGMNNKLPPFPDTVLGVVLGSDVPDTGHFVTSNDQINQLESNIKWSLHGNFMSIPTDCPQRDERMGWMADAQVFLPTATYHCDVAAFMNKWMTDIIDAQRTDGAYSDVAPAMKGLSYGTPAWADAGTIVPWVIYQTYGDRRILERSIDSMMRWVDWCEANSTNLIRDHARGNDYGDWLSIGADTPKDLLGTAYFAHSADIVAKSLAVLGRTKEAAKYAQLFDAIKRAFNEKYVAADGTMTGDTQCDYVLALQFNMLPDDAMRARAVEHLIDNIGRHDWHLTTGFIGSSYILDVLTDAGRSDVAYRLLMQKTMPSWLFPVEHGATTIWERWNGLLADGSINPEAGMNSFNHYAFGSCGRWLFESVAGISRDPSGGPGFEHIIIHPQVAYSPFTFVSGKLDTLVGPIRCGWSIRDGQFLLSIMIPANTTATVFIPSGSADDITCSGQPLSAMPDIKITGRKPGETILEVGSGLYVFSMPWKK